MKNKKILGLLVFILFLFISPVSAHQPRVVFDSENTLENPIIVEDPEISKAYYGELKGEPDYYKIDIDKAFKLYLNILVPANEVRKDFMIEVSSDKESIFVVDSSEYEWKEFFEEFARDNYVRGPEIRKDLEKGVYSIKIYNKDNKGKYSLAIGEIESFPLKEIAKTLFVLPKIKKEFFEKSWFSAFLNIFGLAFFILLAVILVVLFFVFRFVRKRFF